MPGEIEQMHEKADAPKRMGYVWTSCLAINKVILSLRGLGQMHEYQCYHEPIRLIPLQLPQ